jgi:hypothetical protein
VLTLGPDDGEIKSARALSGDPTGIDSEGVTVLGDTAMSAAATRSWPRLAFVELGSLFSAVPLFLRPVDAELLAWPGWHFMPE